MQYVVIIGDPIDGLTFVGPFEDAEEAMAWAEENDDNIRSWWVSDLEMPA